MKKHLIYIIICVLIPLSGIHAQSVQSGVNLFAQFEAARNAGEEATAYNTLWQCYQTLSAAAKTVQPGSADYNTLRNTLRTMHPWMEQGFIYNATSGQRSNSSLYAQAYLDIQLMPCMKGVILEHTDNYSTIAYNASATTYNSHDYKRVIPYFKVYLTTGDTKHRRDVLQFMMDACMKIKDYESARDIMDELVSSGAASSNTLTQCINVCMELRDYNAMQRYLSTALASRPNDSNLLKLQGQAYEETQQYDKAIEVYQRLKAQNPRSLDISKHLSVCNYNLGVLYYNEAEKGNNTKKYQKIAKDYFYEASSVLANVVAVETTSLKYHQALATAYLYSDQADKLAPVNQKIASLGGVTIAQGMAPVAISTSNNAVADNSVAHTQSNTTTPGVSAPAASPITDDIPLYSVFAKQYVEERLKQWQQKDAYETAEEYKARVNEDARDAKLKELLKQAEAQYISTYTANIRFAKELTLRPYDAENRVFLVESDYGELIVPVPRENNEARSFEQSWNGMQFVKPQFYINNDRLMLSALTFVTPSGKSYQFTGDKNLNYTETEVDVHFDNLDSSLFASNTSSSATSKKREKQKVSVGQSDVDMDIPESKSKAENTFAVIIGNEDYSMVSPVPMAKNDGEVFAQYCEKTLGLPKNNVRLYKNASYGVMIRAMRDIASIATAYQGDLDVIFYYAGHGIPNESTKDAYLLPIDADGTQTEGCYSLNKLYSELGALKARSVLVFLDACFSGAKRDGGMLASARGVALKAKKEDPKGNMVIFSAASDDETAMPYTEKNHGLFTYFLLKKLKESKGNVTLSDLGDYISSNVRKQATVVNHKPQTPSVVPSTSMADTWQRMKLINK